MNNSCEDSINININLELDYIEISYEKILTLIKIGFKFKKFQRWKNEDKNKKKNFIDYKSDLFFDYWNIKEKIMIDCPRKIVYCTDFRCPSKYKKGLTLLESKIEKGEPLFPHFSRKIYDYRFNDGMLLDFGICHLHLGSKASSKHKGLIEGTADILYCMFNDDIAYFIKIDAHGKWNDTNLLKKIKEDFPKVLKKFKVEGIENVHPKINEKERGLLRKYNVNSLIEIDGSYYMSPGGG